MKEKLLGILGIVILIGLGVMVFTSEKFSRYKIPSFSVDISPTPNPYIKWATYKNITSRYNMKISPDWEITEKDPSDSYETQVLFHPRTPAKSPSSITETSITVVATPKPNQQLTTQEEFDQWYLRDTKEKTESRIQKIDTTSIDGKRAVVLRDMNSENEWSYVTWVRKDDKNYYINMRGNGKATIDDEATYRYLLTTIHFFK